MKKSKRNLSKHKLPSIYTKFFDKDDQNFLLKDSNSLLKVLLFLYSYKPTSYKKFCKIIVNRIEKHLFNEFGIKIDGDDILNKGNSS